MQKGMGRQGQAQAGVDVYGYNHSSRESIGSQCKKNPVRVPSRRLTAAEIGTEVEAAKMFSPKLGQGIAIAVVENLTSGPIRSLR